MEINKLLSEKLGLDDDSKEAINEAWNQKLKEARQEIESEVREEYAVKYEHDKKKITNAVDRKLNEQLQEEMSELAEDKAKLRKAQVEYKKKIEEHTKLLNRFINRELVKELREFKKDRENMQKKLDETEKFIDQRLNEELAEFNTDTKNLRAIKVKQLQEHKRKLEETRDKFIKEAASKTNAFLNETIKKEIKQYRDDIIEARNNDFGKRIFEAFASEYLTSYLNESSEINKLSKKLNETIKLSKKQSQLLEETENRYKANRNLLERERKLNKLLSPLSKENRAIMTDLLEGVSNEKLENQFEKYLPAILNESSPARAKKNILLSEGRTSKGGGKIKDGNRRKSTITENKSSHEDDDYSRELDEIYKLAGTTKGD